MRFLTAVCALAMAAVWAGPAAAEDDPQFLSFSGGALDINDDETAAMFGAEWRSDYKKLILTPMAGGFVATDGSVYGYAGVFVDFFFGDRVVVRPNFAVGAYEDGNGKDLGGVLEFRSGIEMAWRFDNRSRLGVEFTHISNAGIYDRNPGTETLTVNYSVSLDSLF